MCLQARSSDQEADRAPILRQLEGNGLLMLDNIDDRNSFFHAIVTLVKEKNPLVDVESLKGLISDHIKEYMAEYEHFSAEGTELSDLDGWNQSVANAVFLATANLFQANVQIFTNQPGLHVKTIEPSLIDKTHPHSDQFTVLRVAHIAKEDSDLYKPCVSANEENFIIPVLNYDKNAESGLAGGTSTVNEEVTVNEECQTIRRSRKRKADPTTWKANIRHKQRMLGMQYTRRDGKITAARKMKPVNGSCKYGCCDKFDEIELGSIFADYWSLENKERKQDFICTMVEECSPKTRKTGIDSKRNTSRAFYLQVLILDQSQMVVL